MILDAFTVIIVHIINFITNLNSAVHAFDDYEISNYIKEIQESEDVRRQVENDDDIDGRRSSEYQCWVRGGICIDIDACRNHEFHTQVHGCRGDRKVCCMSYNFRELKDLTSFGFKSMLPWKVQTRDTPYIPTAAQIHTYETSKQYYKDLFDIDLNRPQEYQHKGSESDRRSAASGKQKKSKQIGEDDNKMAADYADFHEFFRGVTCEGDQCLDSVKIKIKEKVLDENEPLYYNDTHEDLPKKGIKKVLMLIQKI